MKRATPTISSRKKPRQARSTQLVADILEAAIRVLVRDGARFSTVRVAEEAGVSVGSLYQYFPNKEALLFRLQADEWEDTWGIMEETLLQPGVPPFERLKKATLTFFRSEREEAALRNALEESLGTLDETPDAKKLMARALATVETFLEEVLPGASSKKRASVAKLLMTSLGAIAEEVTAKPCSRAEVDAWANEIAEMFRAYLEKLGVNPL